MSGVSVSEVRSAFVPETTVGTIPGTPAFQTLHTIAALSAKPDIVYLQSQSAKGARSGSGYGHLMVEGSLESPMVYGEFDDLLETLLQGAWSSDVLKDAKLEKTVAFENGTPAGAEGTMTMLRYRGVEAVGGSLNLVAGQAAQLAMQLIGRASDDGTTTALSGATYTDPTEGDPLHSGQDVGAITLSGYTADCIQSAEIQFEFEGRERQQRISSSDLCGVTRGKFLPRVNINFFVEENFLAIYNAARSRHSSFALTLPIGSVTNKKYTIEFPRCVFGETEIDMSGNEVMQKVPVVPLYDEGGEESVIKVTRAVA